MFSRCWNSVRDGGGQKPLLVGRWEFGVQIFVIETCKVFNLCFKSCVAKKNLSFFEIFHF